ncbi:MAG: hypothetical protein O2931_16910 [Planctomycetota bacterium]|nr:hypothetical protein [Planctomycetota bacterium]MDA1180463.1 hypothetical protein [Planctomycetota bacterium]
MRSLACVLACCCIIETAAQGADESSPGVSSRERSSAQASPIAKIKVDQMITHEESAPHDEASDASVVEQTSEQEADFGDRWKAFHLPTIVEWVASMPYPALHRDCAALQFQRQQSEMVAAICGEDNPFCAGLSLVAGHQYLEGNINPEQFDRADRHIFLSGTTRVVRRQ